MSSVRPRCWGPILASLAVALIALCATASPARAGIGPRQIDSYLLEQGSPLAGEGAVFCEAGERYGVDPAFLVAISGAESSYGRFLYSDGPRIASHNAFNWFYAPTRAGSGFTDWGQAIGTVAAGLRGPLYYGAGRYSVTAIAPTYCPQGTQAWIANVSAVMLTLGADPADTRWRGTPLSRPAARSQPLGPTARDGPAARLVVRRPLLVRPAKPVAGAHVRLRFTLTNTGLATGRWGAVILRLQGPAGHTLAVGSRAPLRLVAGGSHAFVADLRLCAGLWRGWVDVEATDGMVLSDRRPVLRIAVARDRGAAARRSRQSARDR